MKYIMLTFLVAISINCISQTTDSILFCKPGVQVFLKTISKFNDPLLEYEQNKPDSYANIIATIDKNGLIKEASIFMINDTVLAGEIYKSVMLTNGNWLNKTHEDQVLHILLSIVYSDGKTPDNNQIKPVSFFNKSVYFKNGRKVNAVDCPIQITVYPTQH